MDFGIVHAKIDEIGYITHAENLGYTHCWVTDSQMIRSNCWAVLALAAQQTRRMRLGTGVNVPGLRLAPVAANGIATINRLAPGRCFIGLGTGHTAMRTLGQKPMRLGPFKEYVQTVRALLRGEEVDYTLNGETHPIRFQMREHRFIDLDHTDAVGQVIDHPQLVADGAQRDGPQPDVDRAAVADSVATRTEQLHPVVGHVGDCDETSREDCHRSHRSGFKQRIMLRLLGVRQCLGP